MLPEYADLAERLRTFSLDEPGATRPFSKRLAAEQGWSAEFAAAAIEEYKRFALLSVAAGHVVTPSKVVDEVWHLHLIYTRNYWDVFCPQVLGRPLHHDPGVGRAGEADRHAQQYAQTLASYRRVFGSEPPAAQWPRGRKRRRPALAAALPMPLLLAPLAAGWLNPFDMRGPDFLLLFAIVYAVSLLFAGVLRFVLRGPAGPACAVQLSPYEKAFLSGGKRRAIEAAVVRLSDERLIDIGPRKLSLSAVWPRPETETDDPLDEAVLEAAERELPITGLWAAARRATAPLESRLQTLELVLEPGQRWLATLLPILLALVVPLAGVYKIYVGLERSRPVAFLVIACLAVAGVSLLVFARPPLRTRRGDATLRQLKREHAANSAAPDADQTEQGSLVNAVALLGLGAVAGTTLAPLQHYLGGAAGQRRSPGDGSSCGSSCGSSGCGGGGCGGGGCGGCGGGGD
ncbi:MAG: TIGR04222 domain-containing membrane protein [Pirellulales bacterium]